MAAPSIYLNSPGSGIPTFSTLADENSRWKSFITGFGLQFALIVAATTLTITAAPELIQYNRIELVPPPAVKTDTYKPPPVTVRVVPRIVVPARTQLEKIAPAPVAIAVKQEIKPILPQTIAKLPEAPAPKFESPVVDRPAGPKVARSIASANFSGSSALPTLKNTPAHEVQTGGFGDPNGVPANPNATAKANIASVGSFDLPSGPGQGNGSGGSRGQRGTVASAGFGNGIATEGGGGGRGTGAQGRVQSTAFQPSPPAPEAPRKRATVEAAATPVSITSKPSPVYTEEARKLHVEGEVLVQVTFTAQGQVRVVRIIRGLGHGLDEQAVRAAEGIRFSPAQREGQPVDSNATLHIVFQLS